MELQERVKRTVELIQGLRHESDQGQYTDIGEAWDVLDEIDGIWQPLYQKQAGSPETRPEDAPGGDSMDPVDP